AMLAGKAAVRRSPRRGGDERRGKTGEIVLRRENQHIGFFIGENVLSEFGGERREALGDCGEPHLGFLRQAAAIAHKSDMIALENPRLFGIKLEFAAPRIKHVDALKHRAVQTDSAAMPGKFWRDLAFDRLNLVIGVGARQMEENGTDAGK